MECCDITACSLQHCLIANEQKKLVCLYIYNDTDYTDENDHVGELTDVMRLLSGDKTATMMSNQCNINSMITVTLQ